MKSSHNQKPKEMGRYRLLEIERDNMQRFESYDTYWPMIHIGS